MKNLHRFTTCLLFMILVIPSISQAAFTGQMEMNLKMPNGTALITYLFGNNVQRMDMTMMLDKIPDPLTTTVITRTSRPDEAMVINQRTKTWSTVNLRTAAEQATLLDFDSSYKLTRLGTEIIKGYTCQHVRLSSSTEQLELWMSGSIADFSTFRLLQSQNPRLSNTSLSKTLSDAGIEGFPVRIVQKNGNGLYVMELRSVSAKTVSESSFTVPAGYTRTESTGKAVDSKEKAHLRELMRKMKDFQK